jgi:hypothetical protein
VRCRAQAFLRNLRAGFDDLAAAAVAHPRRGPPVLDAWDELTALLLAPCALLAATGDHGTASC